MFTAGVKDQLRGVQHLRQCIVLAMDRARSIPAIVVLISELMAMKQLGTVFAAAE
jgi:hypothetical protein